MGQEKSRMLRLLNFGPLPSKANFPDHEKAWILAEAERGYLYIFHVADDHAIVALTERGSAEVGL